MAATITETDAKVTVTTGSSFSFTSTALGTPAADRYIIVCACTEDTTSTATINSVTVAGATCNLLTSNNVNLKTQNAIYITSAPDTSNSTGTVVVNLSTGSSPSFGIVVYAVTGLASNAADGTPQTTTTSGATMSLPVGAGGIAVGHVTTSSGTTPNFTWSGLTEDIDQSARASKLLQGTASLASGSAQTVSVIATATNTGSFAACCVALAGAGGGPTQKGNFFLFF